MGKDVVARYIHSHSSRRLAPFVAVNCAGVTETLLESELFGHVKGSFTGAYRDKRGKLQLAHRGTLFLDEVGEMSLRMQALLLRFLENGEIQAVGSDQSQARVDVRVIAATNRNLTELVAAGQFREDLLYRLRVIHLHVPPLRERPEDVQALMQHFLARRRARSELHGRCASGVSDTTGGRATSASSGTSSNSWSGCRRRASSGSSTFPSRCAAHPALLTPVADRRRQVADELYDALVKQGASFWEHVYPMFLARDITRHDLRELVRRGLRESRGRYKSLLDAVRHVEPRLSPLHELPGGARMCGVGFREFRGGRSASHAESEAPRSYSAARNCRTEFPAESDSHVQ